MGQGRILIIDDDPDITEAMTVVLENKGYEVRSARDGNEGMERLKEARPDLIILDVMMRTSQEGFEFSREIKHNAQFKDIPILMLTAVKEKKGLDFKSEPATGTRILAARRGIPRQAGQAERADREGRRSCCQKS